jgi:hypothetical protein
VGTAVSAALAARSPFSTEFSGSPLLRHAANSKSKAINHTIVCFMEAPYTVHAYLAHTTNWQVDSLII